MVELRGVHVWRRGRQGKVPKRGCVLPGSAVQEHAVRVSTGEELCGGLRRGCSLDCPFGFLTDHHNCEICECRPRPKKCRFRFTDCDKDCPFGYQYVFLNPEDLFLLVCDLVQRLCPSLSAALCLCERISGVLSPECVCVVSGD